MVAKITNKDPAEKLKLSVPSKESKILDNVIKAIAVYNLPETFSLNITNAIKVVATISKFPSNEAFAAEPRLIPISKNIGIAISSKIIPMVYGKSCFVSCSVLS